MVQLLHRRRIIAETPAVEAPDPMRAGVLERIMTLNPTATEGYLAAFSDRALESYLAHLESAGSPRGARWERPGDSPAILCRETVA